MNTANSREKYIPAASHDWLNQGFADELPYKNRTFDRVFSNFMFHHIPVDKKEKVRIPAFAVRNKSTALVHQVRGWYSGVAIKMGRRQGATREHI
jgi:hypothetical protein